MTQRDRDWIVIDRKLAPRYLSRKFEDIKREVAERHGLPVQVIHGKSRYAPHARARQEAMYLGLTLTRLSAPDIARRLHLKCHSSVFYGAARYALENGLPNPTGFDLEKKMFRQASGHARRVWKTGKTKSCAAEETVR